MVSQASPRLLIAASGTGGHVFPALALADQLSDYEIEWLGVPDRLETQLVGDRYPLHTIDVGGFQGGLGLGSLKVLGRLLKGVVQVRQLLQQGRFQGVFTTGGYISGPAIVAARSLGLPVILHESNALPGKVTRWLSPLCSLVALGFEEAATHLPRAQTTYVGTPVRPDFLDNTQTKLPLEIPAGVPLIVVAGGSQGAIALNQMVRQAAPAWLEAGAWIVHLTGATDPDREAFQHPHYIALAFWDTMAALLQRADLAISRAGAGTLTELAITGTPSILVPYPYAAEDHQTFNGAIFAASGASLVFQQADLSVEQLTQKVLSLLEPGSEALGQMGRQAASLAVHNSAEALATAVREKIEAH